MKKIVAFVAVVAFLASAGSAQAFFFGWGSSSDITVNNSSSATVSNNVTTKADTGDNDADAGNAYNYVSGKGNNGGNTANGGDADIDTGDAWAGSYVLNDVNYNKTKISADCGCKGDINVSNRNSATVGNSVYTKADTGDNDADGGKAKNDVSGSSWSWWFGGNGDNGDNDANGGDADVVTGDAVSESHVSNYVNTNITRIRR